MTADATVQNAFQGDLLGHVQALPQVWQGAFEAEHVRKTLAKLDAFLSDQLQAGAVVFPLRPFRALLEIEPQEVKVVILGQDPYHGPNQAQGLAFSVPDTCPIPPSLRNMFAELGKEYPDTFVPQRHSLIRWARQGVLLLNTSLTVQAHQAGSHAKMGWQIITDAILMHVLRTAGPKVFLLWGAHAQSKHDLIQETSAGGAVHVLKANHPSPLSALRPPRPFMGCGHFRAANEWLEAQGVQGIDWLENRSPARVEQGDEALADDIDEVAGEAKAMTVLQDGNDSAYTETDARADLDDEVRADAKAPASKQDDAADGVQGTLW